MLSPDVPSGIREICATSSFQIVYDHQVELSNGYCRSLPLISRLIDDKLKTIVVRKPRGKDGGNCKRQVHLLDYPVNYHRPEHPTATAGPVCIFSREDDETESHFVSRWIEMQTPRIFITDGPGFVPDAWTSRDRSIEERTPVLPLLYQEELTGYLARHGLSSFRLPETSNLAFTETNYLRWALTGEPAANLTELFDFGEPMLSLLPYWDWLVDLADIKRESPVAQLDVFVFLAFRPHLERNKDLSIVRDIFQELIKGRSMTRERLQKERIQLLERARPRLKVLEISDPCVQDYINRHLVRLQ